MTDTITILDDGTTLRITEVAGDVIKVTEPSLPEAAGAACVNFIIDGVGSAISPGLKGHVPIPFDCVITGWTLVADPSGSMVVDIWKSTYAAFPPNVGGSIVAAAKPAISGGVKASSSTLTGWTTTLSAGDVLAFNVDSASVINRATLSLSLARL